MHPFLTRSSRSSSAPCSTLSNAVLSTSKPAVPPHAHASVFDGDTSSAFQFKFGDFYKRFYSTVTASPTEHKDRDPDGSLPRYRDDICMSGSTLASGGKSTEITRDPLPEGGYQPAHRIVIRTIRRIDRAGIDSGFHCQGEGRQLEKRPSNIRRFHSGQWEKSSLGGSGVWRPPDPAAPGSPAEEGHPQVGVGQRASSGALLNSIPREDQEIKDSRESIKQLVERLMHHELLIFVLVKELKVRMNFGDTNSFLSLDEKRRYEEEVDSLTSAVVRLSTQYYDEGKLSLIVPAVHAGLLADAIAQSRAYVAPLPEYKNFESTYTLNTSLKELLWKRPPVSRPIPEICEHLLSATSPPDTRTFNVIVQGLTLLRQTAAAHMVFRHMVECGMQPDDYSLVAVLNLCAKSNDFDGFSRITKIIRSNTGRANFFPGMDLRIRKRRSKMVLEALIVGSARFGHVQRVDVHLRAMKRECPESPTPGLFTLTALLKLWTEKKDWVQARRVWSTICKMDARREETGEGERLDLRAMQQYVECCRACGKKKALNEFIQSAASRGFSERELELPYGSPKGVRPYAPKIKGLWERPDQKVPWMKGLMSENMQYRQRGLADFLRQAAESEALIHGTMSGDGTAGAQTSSTAPGHGLSAVGKAVIWEDVLANRLEEIRAEVQEIVRQQRLLSGQWRRPMSGQWQQPARQRSAFWQGRGGVRGVDRKRVG